MFAFVCWLLFVLAAPSRSTKMEHVHDGCNGCDLLAKLQQQKAPRTYSTRMLVLYGSETGNGKSIAEKLFGLATSRHIPAELHVLDDYEKVGFLDKHEAKFCAIVCSTTGNGDAPIGAEKFARFVKKRALAEDTVQCRFSVLALGDTNYDKFCYVGKMIDTRLKAIGGQQVAPVVLADEVMGLEGFVEPWIETVLAKYAEGDCPVAVEQVVVEQAVEQPVVVDQPVVDQPVVVDEPVAEPPLTKPSPFIPTPIDDASTDDDTPPRMVILYGSETGNGKSIAEKLLDLSQAQGLVSVLHPLDEYDNVGFVGSKDFFAIICSTTGNGDSPQGSERFVRYVKRRTHAADLLQCSYCVLALGDTNYDKFCYVGKLIDTRLKAIGGRQVLPVVLVDEVLGLEGFVEPWLQQVLQRVQRATAPTSVAAAPVGSAHPTLPVTASVPAPPPAPAPVGWVMPQTFSHGSAEYLAQTAQELEAATKRLGRIRAPISLAKILTNQANLAFHSCTVVDKTVLTSAGDRLVIKMTLALGAGFGPWGVGDAIGIQTGNPKPLVLACAARLGLSSEQDLVALEHHVDLSTTPDRGFLRTLSQHCTDALDSARMNFLSSFEGKQAYEALLQRQKLNVVEVLALFPSCRPSSADVFFGSLMEPPQPRYYSVASSPLVRGGGVVEICFSVVQTTISAIDSEEARVVCGVCTNALHGKQVGDEVMAFAKPNSTFKLPVDKAKPVIMCGPGTGVAPFIGFIQHRLEERAHLALAKRRNAPERGAWRGGLDFDDDGELESDVEPSRSTSPSSSQFVLADAKSTTLYFGCRHPEQDFLYQGELHEFVRTGALGALRVAFSRPSPGSLVGKQYVQDLMTVDGAQLADEILNHGAYVFVCGDGTKMARDVQHTICQILSAHGNLTEGEAKDYVAEMQKRARYVQDIW